VDVGMGRAEGRMAARARANPLMRFAQRVADVAAVAQARYGERLNEERQRLGRSTRREDGRASQLVPPPDRAAPPAPSAAAPQGSEKHQESREKIGDPSAPP